MKRVNRFNITIKQKQKKWIRYLRFNSIISFQIFVGSGNYRSLCSDQNVLFSNTWILKSQLRKVSDIPYKTKQNM